MMLCRLCMLDLPVNLGNPEEYSIKQFAELIKEITGSSSSVVHSDRTADDPHKRKPDISLAEKVSASWQPQFARETDAELDVENLAMERFTVATVQRERLALLQRN